MSEIKAIPTKYNGIEFRSRLEARWAVFFDQLNIKWFYEYEGYETPYGNYLPDFWLPNVKLRFGEEEKTQGILFEVKPRSHNERHDKLEYIANALNVGGILACGFPENADYDNLIEVAPCHDWYMMFYYYAENQTNIEFPEGNYLRYGYGLYDSNIGFYKSNEKVEQAINFANSYRFW